MTSQEINIKLDLLDPSSIHVDYVTRCGHKPLKENLPSSKNTKEQTSKVFERGCTTKNRQVEICTRQIEGVKGELWF
jgi:hypothetical protein